MNTFKAGDRVRCVRGSIASRHLIYGMHYTVYSVSSHYVYIEGIATGGWDCDRFELVKACKPADDIRGYKVEWKHKDGEKGGRLVPIFATEAEAMAGAVAALDAGETFTILKQVAGPTYRVKAKEAELV